jgi:hypothetical protein
MAEGSESDSGSGRKRNQPEPDFRIMPKGFVVTDTDDGRRDRFAVENPEVSERDPDSIS